MLHDSETVNTYNLFSQLDLLRLLQNLLKSFVNSEKVGLNSNLVHMKQERKTVSIT